jgi:GH25 family lysozyme M1 (1,4-beta-N-acetylmuramidase)
MNDLYVPGIDTSHWQFGSTPANVDWKKAAAVGVRWNMIRIGRGSDNTNGTTDTGVDRSMALNHQKSLEAGLEWAGYWRCDHQARSQPERQADVFADAFESLRPSTPAPLVIDVEESTTGTALTSIAATQDWYNEFRARLQYRGHHVAVYTNDSFWDPSVRLGWGDLDLLAPEWIRDAGVAAAPRADARLWPGQAFSYLVGPGIPQEFATWAGWQFSADGNNAGAAFGALSQNIDCNIMKRSVFERWFGASA